MASLAGLAGRNIYEARAERASKRSAEEQARRVAEMRRQQPSIPTRSGRGGVSRAATAVVPIPQAARPSAPAEKRVVTADALAAIKIGMTRAEVLAALGEPSSRFSLTGGDGMRETLRYHLAGGDPVELRLVNGKVTQVP